MRNFFEIAGALIVLWLLALSPAIANPPALPPVKTGAGCNMNRVAGLQTAEVGQEDLWQPRGGDLQFTISRPSGFPNDSIVRTCFRWIQTPDPAPFLEGPPVRNLSVGLSGARTVLVTVPDLPPAPPRYLEGQHEFGLYSAFGLVPMAIVRFLVLDSEGNVIADEYTRIGITRAETAIPMALLIIVIPLLLIAFAGARHSGVRDPVLRLIANRAGYASLSQLQLLLWTFVVGVSATYVIALSGELIDIKPQMLALLGISGAARLGSALKTPEVPGSVPDGSEQSAKPGKRRRPRWSDLTVHNDEVDISRVQMLLFTVVTAVFVLVYVATSYELPEIPDGFLILMGLSNGLYFGSKLATGSAPTAPQPAASPAEPPSALSEATSRSS